MWLDLGNARARAGQVLDAIECYGNALRLDPDSGHTWNNFGNLFMSLKDVDSAVSCYRNAVRLLPSEAQAAYSLGRALILIGHHREARAHLARACNLDPGHSDAWLNLGTAHQHLGDPAEALRCLDRAIILSIDPAEAQTNRAMILIDQGNFAEGWQAYEQRWKLPAFVNARQRFAHKPQWKGEPIDGRRILLYGEQGLGDMIQFSRFIPEVSAHGAEVFLEVPRTLTGLLSGLLAPGHILSRGEPLPDFDLHCPLMSLPLALDLEMSAIPNRPWLRSTEALRQLARRAIDAAPPPVPPLLRAGLCWRGNPSHLWDRIRSLTPLQLAPLAQVAGVQWYLLQQDATPEEIALLRATIALTILPKDQLDGLLPTAALIGELDLVVSVDTATAHLTGALGKPLWLMLPASYDWRWHSQLPDSPWYPSARLYRQMEPGDWSGVVERIAGQLAQLVAAEMRAESNSNPVHPINDDG
jgi:Tetratricopeptide repeat/Glycosyltransferase family 9 (heptosyltransferase)